MCENGKTLLIKYVMCNRIKSCPKKCENKQNLCKKNYTAFVKKKKKNYKINK